MLLVSHLFHQLRTTACETVERTGFLTALEDERKSRGRCEIDSTGLRIEVGSLKAHNLGGDRIHVQNGNPQIAVVFIGTLIGVDRNAQTLLLREKNAQLHHQAIFQHRALCAVAT